MNYTLKGLTKHLSNHQQLFNSQAQHQVLAVPHPQQVNQVVVHLLALLRKLRAVRVLNQVQTLHLAAQYQVVAKNNNLQALPVQKINKKETAKNVQIHAQRPENLAL